METRIRSFALVALSIPALAAFAQATYTLHVNGQLAGCTAGQQVTVQTMPGTTPEQTVNTTVDADCSYQATLFMDSSTGGVFAWSTCGNGTVTADSTSYAFNNPVDSALIDLQLACGGDTSSACQACITVSQSAPFTADFTSCSSGGTPPYTNVWLLPNGTISLNQQPTFTFTGPGAYGICLQSSDATGCTSVACDTLYIGADGSLNPPNTEPCQAGFWVVQAYSDTSNGSNVLAPIPNEVWVWNLSTADAPIDQYFWEFGDGNTSSDAYPSHYYDGPGPYVLCLTIGSGNCTAMFCDTVSLDDDGFLNGMALGNGHSATQHSVERSGGFTLNVLQSLPTGVAELPALADFRMWPNPAQDELNLSFTSLRAGAMPVTVLSTDGRAVLSYNFNLVTGKNAFWLSTHDLAPGLYMIRIGDDARSLTRRFLKVR